MKALSQVTSLPGVFYRQTIASAPNEASSVLATNGPGALPSARAYVQAIEPMDVSCMT